MVTLALTALFAAGLVPLIQRDLRRARMRILLRPFAASQRALHQAQIAVALIPAMREMVRAAADMEATMRRVAEVIKADRVRNGEVDKGAWLRAKGEA